MSKSYQTEYRENMPDEQKQRYRDKQREASKRYRDNMSDEQKQKLKDYQKDYQKKYYAVKKLNNKITNDKIINDFYCISIIIKLKKNIVPIKDINSILKINKKVYSKAYLKGCNFINDCDNKND